MKILVLSINDWLGLKQRVHHIAEYLSEHNDIVFFCQTTWMKNNYNSYSRDEIKKRIIPVSNSLTIRRMTVLPLNRLNVVNKINTVIKKRVIMKIEREFKPDCIITTLPEQYSVIPKDYEGLILYDCMDDHASFGGKIKLNVYEKRLIQRANAVTVSSERLARKIEGYNLNKKIEIVKNATRFEVFHDYITKNNGKKRPEELELGKKIIGYFGVVRDWFNIEAVIKSASQHKDCEYIIIGPIDNPVTRIKLNQYSNIKCIGQRKFEDLPQYLYYFDVCIMPFKLSELIENVNPVKLYEYLSMGKPTVVTYYEEIQQFEPYVYFAKDDDDFCDKVSRALCENNESLLKKRIEFAESNTWKVRTDQMMAVINTL